MKIKNLNKKKTSIIVVILLILLAIAIIAIAVATKQNPSAQGNHGNNINSSTTDPWLDDPNFVETDELKRISHAQDYKGLEITNVEIELIEPRKCEIRAQVKNTTSEMMEVQNIKITTYDAGGNKLDTLGAQIDSLKPGDTTTLYALVRRNNITDIAEIKIEENTPAPQQ